MFQASPSFDLLSVFNAQPGATLLLSPEWVIVGASDDYLAATLTQRDSLVGQFIFDAFPDNPETPEANAVANVRASLAQVMATRQPHDMAPQHYDVPDPARPGHFIERHWKPRHTPVLDPAGQVQFLIHSVQDITASRLAERQLRESQAREQAALAEAETQRQRLYNVLMQLPAYVAVYYGPDHVYQFVNPSYQRLFPHRSFVGRPFREGMPESEGLGVIALFDQVYHTGEPYYGHEMEGWFDFGGDGKLRQIFFELSLHPLRNVRGEVDGVLDFSYDVTEQVLARRQLQQFNQELEFRVQQRTEELAATNAELYQSNTRLRHTNADLDNFVYTASHDLKSPISNIEGLLLLLPELLPKAVQEDKQVAPVLAHMQESAERFKRTINHLTDVSRLQAEFTQPAMPVRLADIVEDVRQDLLPQLTQDQAQLEVHVAESWPRVFSGKNLRSIVYNLLSNALKYRHPDRPPHVRIACVPADNQLVLTVQDNGLGMSAQQQTRLFQLFQRLHTHVEGTGVGLYMVKRIVEQAGGTITVQSQLGVGTTFTLAFPA